jgi:hypothetical protein
MKDKPDHMTHVRNCTHEVRSDTRGQAQRLDVMARMMRYVLVYGAYGHTGRFVVTELLNRGLTPIVSGRDGSKLAGQFPGLEVRPASVDDARSLDNAVRGAEVVINCAGPFLDTALPVAAAAVRAGAHYLDVTAEQPAVQQLYDAHDHDTGVAVIPAMAFYGGLPDLLATTVAAGWETLDEVTVAIGLDSWWPTEGSRKTGRRNTATRLVVDGGRLVPAPDPATRRDWRFPGLPECRTVVGVPFSEIITLGHHLAASRIATYLSANALEDVRDPATPPPVPADETGRSAQRFVVDVALRRGDKERRISAAGRDIYAVCAPLIAEAATRLIDGRAKVTGAAAPGEVFDAADFLNALGPEHLTVAWSGHP